MNKIKQFFTKIFKKHKTIVSEELKDQVVTFKDAILQQISFELVTAGNGVLAKIKLVKQKQEIVLDNEQALIVAALLNSYGQNNTIANIINAFGEPTTEERIEK